MGIDTLIQNNNPNWDNNVDFIKIDNMICRSMKAINRALKKELEEKKKKGLSPQEIKEQKEKQRLIDKQKKYYLRKLESNDY